MPPLRIQTDARALDHVRDQLPTDVSERIVRELSASLTKLVSAVIEVPTNRVFISFVVMPRPMLGWNGGTFETAPD